MNDESYDEEIWAHSALIDSMPVCLRKPLQIVQSKPIIWAKFEKMLRHKNLMRGNPRQTRAPPATAHGSLVQVVSKNLTTPGTTQTSSAISTTAHNALVFFAVYKAVNAGVVTPSDSTGLTWVLEQTYSGGATGLTLSVWVANNITGNAANTFTFATTGADTPTFFVAELSGRDLNVPFDALITASDTISASGAHTTGTLMARGGDDLLAFNVSSSLSQSYSATGLWAIPPNGTITTAAGYDAFVQYINNANNGTNSNTYSVGAADKLDAIIIALKPPALPYSDEWLDYWIEEPEVYAHITSVQQQTLPSQSNDVDQDWLDEAGDNEAWLSIEDQSGIVVADVITGASNQYFGEDAEQLDEVLNLESTPSGYQQSDNTPPLGSSNLDEPFDWFQEIDDDEWIFRDESNVQNPSVLDTTSLVLDAIIIDDQDDDPDDFFADDFGNDDADLPQNDVWDHWPTDEDDYAVEDSYILLTNPGPLPITIEDGWDHFTTDDDDWVIPDDYENDQNSLLNTEDPSWWDEEPDQYDGTTTDLDPVGSNNNPIINVEDSWDHFTTDDDDYVVIDDYAIVDVVPVITITVEDPFDQFVTDDDEYFIVDEYVLVNNIPAIAQPPDDSIDWTQDDDDWVIPDDYAIIDVIGNPQSPVEDAWDHFTTDDDDYVVIDDFQLINNTPIVVEDAWDHFTTDPDDELYHALDTDQVSVPQPAAIEDPWDWTQDADDEEWAFRDMDAVGPLAILNSPTDGWDHFTTDDDDWAIPDDYAIVDVLTAPSQFTDDSWDFFYEPAEDNELDVFIEDSALPLSVYVSDPNFEVYMPLRSFTVIWLPTGMGTC